jgi:FlaA1/EpsC-like NDP-sugar epimerase
MKFTVKNVPRWIILCIDVFIVITSFLLSFLIRFDFNVPAHEFQKLDYILLLAVAIRGISFLISKTYAGIIRYTSTFDAVRIIIVLFSGSLCFIAINLINFHFFDGTYIFPFSIIIMDFFISALLMMAFRVIVKLSYLELNNPNKEKSRIIIYGAGESGLITKRSLDRDMGTKYKVIAFLDDDSHKKGKTLEGIPIYHSSKMGELLSTNDVDQLILSIQNLDKKRKQQIIEECLSYNINPMIVPPVKKWINGELSYRQIKQVRIEDLLDRAEIKLEEEHLKKEIRGKTILLSGAAGSIGSELMRQIVLLEPEILICVDQAESALYDIDMELHNQKGIAPYQTIIADITNKERIREIFNTHKIDMLFHAAAYKHVPLMEQHPFEAVNTNVFGTKNLADLAVEFGVKKFIMVSTDKAVNPSSVMGASKRLAEIYTQTLNQLNKTAFITTRFGNVLGSNGSVIPLFRKQIEKGGPITVTDPNVTRFFMTIPEACQLVIEAGVMGEGGEIFIFDMGESVKILDLAKKMIKLSGLELGKDIQIQFTGLRDGEKLYEELLNNKEEHLPTYHEKIMRAKVKEYALENIRLHLQEILEIEKDKELLIRKMKEIIPEYKSMNSRYQNLDD